MSDATPKALVVDDSPEIHELIDSRLKPENVPIHHAHDAYSDATVAAELTASMIREGLDPTATVIDTAMFFWLRAQLSDVPFFDVGKQRQDLRSRQSC